MEQFDMNEAGNTSFTNMRRSYPRERNGAKDEWKALIKHQHEINELIGQREKEIKKLRQEDLGKAYDQKRRDEISVKEADLRQKQEEAVKIKGQTDQYHQELARNKEDKQVLKNHLANHYENHMDAIHQTQQYHRELNLHQDNQMVANAKQRLEESQRKEAQKKEEYHQVFNDEIRRAEDRNQQLLENKIKDKLDYRDNIRENERKQMLKEENYRNFFKLSVENQKKLMDLHAQNVLSPQLQKDAEMQHIVNNRINEERERKERDMANRQQWKEHNTHYVSNCNKDQIDHHDHVKHIERQDKQLTVQESLKHSMEYHDHLNSTKYVKKENQKNYKEFLDRQKVEQDEKARMNKMTKHEKKINQMDLQSYKDSSTKMYGILPGFMHSKYEHPLGGTEINFSPGRRNKANIYAEKLNTLQTSSNFSPASPRYEAYNRTEQSPTAQQFSPVKNKQFDDGRGSYSPEKTFTKLNQTYEARDLNPNYRSMTNMPSINSSPMRGGNSSPMKPSHNPITNPLPYNNQNPYIAREINQAQTQTQRRPYFANMATNNLIG